MKLPLSALAVALVSAAACAESPTEVPCDPVPQQIATTAGDTIITTTGLRYLQVQAGTGATAESCREAAVQYALRLEGSDSIVDSGSFAFVPGQGRVIPGFEQGVVGMQVGGERRLIVPPELGYGSTPRTDQQGNVVIPANSTLIFDVTLLGAE